MPKELFVSFSEINETQRKVMTFVEFWVKSERTPVPRQEILENMKNDGLKESTVILAINELLLKGYIRKAIIITPKVNQRSYVQLRRV